MPKAGDSYVVELKEAHLNWGTRGRSREDVVRHDLEAYVKIPLKEARRLGIGAGTEYLGTSDDGRLNAKVKASGSAGENLKYAKQFQGYRDLKLFGRWLKRHCNAQAGDSVLVEFLSATEVKFTHLPAQ